MADLNDVQSAEPVKIVGSDANGIESNPVNASSNGELLTNDRVNTSAVYNQISIGTTAVAARVGASNLVERKVIHITPKSNGLYWGYNNSVTTTTGTKMFKDSTYTFKYGPNITVWLIGDAVGKTANVGEIS